MEHPLTSAHRAGRLRLLELGHSLSAAEADRRTTACPEWSIKDVYAHLAGISTDILAGNTENAATVAWADGHVADRSESSLSEVLDEWAGAGAEVDGLLATAGEAFPFQLFLDQWTHEWDVRAAVGPAAAASPDLDVCAYVREPLIASMQSRAPASAGTLTVGSGADSFDLGDGAPLGALPLTPFEFTRVSMGRRSAAQLDALAWPTSVTDRTPWIDALVIWSVNELDVDDPLSSG